MSMTVEAMYEDGVLKPSRPLPLEEHGRDQEGEEPKGGIGS
jgi:predicted DNA-binding antitoxin AbrB/MazE fold protein